MSCSKTAYKTEGAALHGARRVGALNGHPMRHYQCDVCGRWHLTSDDNQILPWKRVRYWHFTAKAPGHRTGKYSVLRDKKTHKWYAWLPDGRKAGPFDDLGTARQWVDALTFLPTEKWAKEIERVSA